MSRHVAYPRVGKGLAAKVAQDAHSLLGVGQPTDQQFLDRTLREELLNVEIFDTLLEAQVPVKRWRTYYNTVRPHSALNYRPPAPEVIQPWPPGAATHRLTAMVIQAIGLT